MATLSHKTGLLDMPTEIRRQIYQIIFRDSIVQVTCPMPFHCEDIYKHPNERYNGIHKDLAISMVSKPLRAETLLEFLASATFNADGVHNVVSPTCQHMDDHTLRHVEECFSRIQRISGSDKLLQQMYRGESWRYTSCWTLKQCRTSDLKEVTLSVNLLYSGAHRGYILDDKRVEKLREIMQDQHKGTRLTLDIKLLWPDRSKDEDSIGTVKVIDGVAVMLKSPRAWVDEKLFRETLKRMGLTNRADIVQ